jgi:hypothetical protein
MKIINQNSTIRDYREAMLRGDIVINRDYQRSNQVWPDMAKSYLMETILLEFPIPKLFLHQAIDAKTRKPIKHIVDGQQRTQAIMDFMEDKFALSEKIETEELRGLKYSELDEEYTDKFLDYGLYVDLFTAAPIEEVIEVFRRMNSYTVPLNPEEKRHAGFQGDFKWFINRLVKLTEPTFRTLGAFSDKQFFRMADSKLLTEICHAIDNGITTTNARSLDGIYRKFNKKWEGEDDMEEPITTALGEIAGWVDLHNGPLMKPYQLYSLVLAVAHVRCKIPKLQDVYRVARAKAIDSAEALEALSKLAEAVEQGEEADSDYEDFVLASTSKTNVKKERETRFKWFCKAITGA